MLISHTPTAVTSRAATPIQKRNTLADWAFYDVGNLTEPEFQWLASQPNVEGSVLVVEPTGHRNERRIRKHETHAVMRSAPGDLIEHFAIAGVGSSDVGAAALARTHADMLDRPVGAIVAGYGMADILQEALGGWFFFGAANRAQARLERLSSGPSPTEVTTEVSAKKALEDRPNDTHTLIKLLSDPDRTIRSLLGHSKGCLSIAFALNDIADHGSEQSIGRHADIEVITTGAVCELPAAMTRVRQYLGALEWFGGINSVGGIDFVRVPNAWHHVNTELPYHMNLTEVLRGHYDP